MRKHEEDTGCAPMTDTANGGSAAKRSCMDAADNDGSCVEVPNTPLSECISMVRKLIALSRKVKGFELELRFGKLHNGKFIPGITRSVMDDFINMMQTNRSIRHTEWDEFCDFFFPMVYENKNIVARTRVSYDTNYLCTEKTHCIKNKLHHIVFSVGVSNVAFKLELSQEVLIDQWNMPQIISSTTLVRMQQRRCFLHGGKEGDENWKYDFSMTWSGETKTAAEVLQKTEEPVFEFEIELNGKDYYGKHDDEYLSNSLLMKALDFYTNYDGMKSDNLRIVSHNI